MSKLFPNKFCLPQCHQSFRTSKLEPAAANTRPNHHRALVSNELLHSYNTEIQLISQIHRVNNG